MIQPNHFRMCVYIYITELGRQLHKVHAREKNYFHKINACHFLPQTSHDACFILPLYIRKHQTYTVHSRGKNYFRKIHACHFFYELHMMHVLFSTYKKTPDIRTDSGGGVILRLPLPVINLYDRGG